MEFTKPVQCPRCGNEAPMRVVASYEHCPRERYLNGCPNYGETWRLMICPACSEVNVGLVEWIHFDIEDEVRIRVVYPARNRTLIGLPPEIDRAYDTALKVRSVDGNAFAVLLGRVLDLICIDKQVSGSTLYERLNSLAGKGIVPPQLVAMAHQLRQLRNIGAHADLGELTPSEVPVLHGLCRAILEYVYIAPQLVEAVDKRLQQLKSESRSELVSAKDNADGRKGSA
jgi:hypothetical protein